MLTVLSELLLTVRLASIRIFSAVITEAGITVVTAVNVTDIKTEKAGYYPRRDRVHIRTEGDEIAAALTADGVALVHEKGEGVFDCDYAYAELARNEPL